jgi:large subunit ribosomal protein L31e
MPKGKKKAAKKEKIEDEEIKEIEEESEDIKAESEELKEEEEEDTSIEEEIIEIGEKKEDLGKKFKEIPAMEEEIGEIVEERLYTINLGRVKIARVKKRAKRAVAMLREFVVRHMKPESLSIDPLVNELIWARGIEKPPRKLRIRVTKDREGLVTVYPVTPVD